MSKAELQSKYMEQFGEVADESMTVAQLRAAMKPVKETKPSNAVGQFWKNPVHFEKFGTISGKVLAEHAKEFEEITPDATNIMDWVLDYDPIAKRKADARTKARNRAGLPAD